jgi:hypothetical protein
MAASPRSYRNIEEFEREEIRPSFRIGFSVEDLEEGSFEAELPLDTERDLFDFDGVEEGAEDEEDEDEDEEIESDA